MTHLLLNRESYRIELSHFYHLLSAYVYDTKMMEELRRAVIEAIAKAKESYETQIVNMDRIDFCLHVHPSGSISIMTCIRHFDNVIIS
jgi:hypothetical protein